MAKEKKEKKEKKAKSVEKEAKEEVVVVKKEKKAKKDKKEKVVAEESPKKEKKEKKEKKRKEEEAEAPESEKKKEKKAKKAKKEEADAEEVEAAEEPAMKVHSKATPAPETPKEATCEVFMGNLAWSIDEASLQEAMKECGTITNCKWLEDRDTGKFKGCGFISFSSPEEAAKAVAMNGTEILGRAIKCDFSQGKPKAAGGGAREVRPMQAKPEGCNTLFCGNLSFDIDDDQMKAFFKDCGEVSSIRWLTDKETQQFKGCGFVEFADPDSALDLAAKLNGTELLGRSIRIDFAAPRAPKQW